MATIRGIGILALPSTPVFGEVVDNVADIEMCVKIHPDFLSAKKSIRRKSLS